MAAAGFTAALSSMYICEGLLLSPLEGLRIKKQLDAVDRTYDKKQSLFKGHVVCFLRSLVQSFVTLTIESYYYTGFFGVLAGVVLSHPLDTIRTRMAISDRSFGELTKQPWDGLLWNCLRAVPYHWLSRLYTALLANLIGTDEVEAPWWLRTLAFSLSAITLSPLEALRHLDQAAVVSRTSENNRPATGPRNAEALARRSLGLDGSKAQPGLLFAGSWLAVPEMANIILLRRFLTDLIYFPLIYITYGPEVFETPPQYTN